MWFYHILLKIFIIFSIFWTSCTRTYYVFTNAFVVTYGLKSRCNTNSTIISIKWWIFLSSNTYYVWYQISKINSVLLVTYTLYYWHNWLHFELNNLKIPNDVLIFGRHSWMMFVAGVTALSNISEITCFSVRNCLLCIYNTKRSKRVNSWFDKNKHKKLKWNQ